ncbi:MAG: serine/threonine protein kinase [Trichocoleus desertorum ATA4-8-CV12]|jgi:WD40 repeat protein/tRNA A-37 threonylcarbamoyl transferase component Bud32|nr:serine/threonine protein kinase [Trichocoleus desertorum ATA4-8-CV12]
MICCLNPNCKQPQNPDSATVCQSCEAKLFPLLRDRYRILQPIGQGGFGRTYLAIDEDRLKTRCVVKQFSPQVQSARSLDKAIRLFDQEAVRLHELGEHPQIPALLAYFEQEQRLYLVQQFIEGLNLAQELHQQGRFSEQKIRDVLNDLLPVLRFVHECQVVHRDITPSNIVRRKLDQKLVLIDFGVAKLLSDVTLAQPGTKIGTEGYSPIEQLRSGKAYPASDLYSLGATCLYLMTQVKPEELYDPLKGRWLWQEYLARKGVNVSSQLGQILDKLLKDLVSDRYQSVDEVLQDLQAVPPSLPDSAPKPTNPPLSSIPPTSQPPRSRPLTSQPPLRVSNRSGSSSSSGSSSGSTSGAISGPRASAPISQPASSKPPSSSHSFSGPPKSQLALWKCVGTLTGHSSWVMSLAISSRKQILVSGSLDDTLKVWNLQTGNLIRTLPGHLKAINSVAISPDGQLLVSGSDDTTVKIWNLQTGDLLHNLVGHSRDVNSVMITPNGLLLASGSEDRTVRLWKVRTGELLRTLSGTAGMVKSVVISPNSLLLASGGLDNQIKLWHLGSGELTRTLYGHFNSVNSVAITPDGQILASGSKDKTIRLWNLQTGELIRTLTGHADMVNAIAITPDGRMLISGSSDKTIKVWSVGTGDLICTLKDHSNPISAIAISAGGQLFASGSWDNTIKIWQLTS